MVMTKEYGYIIDYKDLFKSLEGAVKDYTSGAFDGFDKDDVAGLLQDRLSKAREHLEEAREVDKASLRTCRSAARFGILLAIFLPPETAVMLNSSRTTSRIAWLLYKACGVARSLHLQISRTNCA